MIIALDYDGTYTEDPVAWNAVVHMLESAGHEVLVVTMRYPEEVIRICPVERDKLWYTSRRAKAPFMKHHGIEVDVWIDDRPEFILRTSEEALWPKHLVDAQSDRLEKLVGTPPESEFRPGRVGKELDSG